MGKKKGRDILAWNPRHGIVQGEKGIIDLTKSF